MALVYWFADGVGKDVNTTDDDSIAIPTAMIRWVRANGSPSLIVYGGDVYPNGDSSAFAEFFDQMDRDARLICETPGNHDWMDDPVVPGAGRIPHGFESFWGQHPESRQPIDNTKTGGARYEHFIDLDGWRLFFLDSGDYDVAAWPAGDESRVTWLTSHLLPGRANIIFAHHSRLSRGHHGDNDRLHRLWQLLFDANAVPRVALMLGGHDHNVSIYGPRDRNHPKDGSVAFDRGIYIVVNGAGGDGHYSQGLLMRGTNPDIFKDDSRFFMTRLTLVDARTLDVDILDFGTDASVDPQPVSNAHRHITWP